MSALAPTKPPAPAGLLSAFSWPVYNHGEQRPRALVRIVLHLVLFIGLMAGLARGTEAVDDAAAASPEGFFGRGAIGMVYALAGLVSVWAAARFVDRRSLDERGGRVGPGYAVDAAFGALLGGMLMAGILGVEQLAGLATYSWAPDLPGDVPRWAFVPVAAIAFLAVSVVEEFVSRGYYLPNLSEGLTGRFVPPAYATIAAVLLSSAAFGAAHLGNPHASWVAAGQIFLAGVMLAVGYVTTGNLAIPLGLHFGWNFFQNTFAMPVSGQTRFGVAAILAREEHGPAWITGGDFGPEAGVTGLAAIGVGTLAVLAWVRLRRGALRIHPTFLEASARPSPVRS